MATHPTLQEMWPWRPTRGSSGSRRTEPPAPPGPSQQERLLHVTEAHLLGAISAHEAELMCALIEHFPDDLPEHNPMRTLADLDIYREFSTNPQERPGEWLIWTQTGGKPLRWWKRLYAQIIAVDE